MMRTKGLLMATLLAPTFLAAQPAAGNRQPQRGETGVPDREAVSSLELHLEHAVAEVSVPHAGILLGHTNTSRGYRLPGYGIIFVLTPRALPGGEPSVVVFRGRPSGSGSHVDLHTEDVTSTEIEALERQVLILQHAAEAEHRAAEEDQKRIVRDVQIRFSGPNVPKVRELSEDDSPDVFAGETASTTGEPDSPGFLPKTAPPWSFWFERGAQEEGRSADRVVQDVRAAVIEVLEQQGAGVAGLREDEFVTVAVDFVPGGLFAARRRPSRTLIVRARQGDLSALAQGTIAPEELRDRVEVIEY